MAWWSVSLFLLSVTYLTYLHPPATWTLLPQWLRPAKRRIQPGLDPAKEGLSGDSPDSVKEISLEKQRSHAQTLEERAEVPVGLSAGEVEAKQPTEKLQAIPVLVQEEEEEEEEQRSSLEEDEEGDKTPQAKPALASAPAQVPSFTLDDSHTAPIHDEEEEQDERDNLPPPMFPAANSAQRATKQPSPSLMMPPPSKPSPSPGMMPPPAKPSASLGAMPPPAAPRQSSSLMPPPRGPPVRTQQTTPSSLRVPSNGPTPNRGGLNPPPSSAAQARGGLAPSRIDTPNSRNKVQLTPGHSPLDWATLSRSKNLSGVPCFQRVTPSMLKFHNGRKDRETGLKKDAWSVFQGKVYNISPYLDFHPGGVGELLRGAGKDGTSLFMEVHPWVNWEGMMGSCLVGVMVSEEVDEGLEGLD